MLLHLYSANMAQKQGKKTVKLDDEERREPNGHMRVPNATDRQAHDAQEFELEGLIDDEDERDAEGGAGKVNGRAH